MQTSTLEAVVFFNNAVDSFLQLEINFASEYLLIGHWQVK